MLKRFLIVLSLVSLPVILVACDEDMSGAKNTAKQEEKEAKKLEKEKLKQEKKEKKEAKKEEKRKKKEKKKLEKEKKKEEKQKKKEEKRLKKEKEKEQKKEEKEKDTKEKSITEILESEDKNVHRATFEKGILTIENEATSFWNESSLFHTVYDLFESTHEAFKDKTVNEVELIIKTNMIDQKGNENLEPVIEYIYTRETFEELNFNNFSNMAFSEQWRILNQADQYMIHPGIYKNLKSKYTNNLENGMSKFAPVE